MINNNSEFDNYAKDYQFGCDNYIKKILGSKPGDYLNIKINWLKPFLLHKVIKSSKSQINLLDYGCGNGLFLHLINKLDLNIHLSGLDTSKEMLTNAKKLLLSDKIDQLFFIPDEVNSIPTNYYDVIIISSVLHHIAIKDRLDVFKKLEKLLAPGGYLIIFEHNPNNPITNYVVRHTTIDQNAILLKPKEIFDYLKDINNLQFFNLNYLMFLPPRLQHQLTRLIERLLIKLPYGAQYALIAKKI